VIEEHGMKLTNYKRICPQINADEREFGVNFQPSEQKESREFLSVDKTLEVTIG
jgi:hypothetical protein